REANELRNDAAPRLVEAHGAPSVDRAARAGRVAGRDPLLVALPGEHDANRIVLALLGLETREEHRRQELREHAVADPAAARVVLGDALAQNGYQRRREDVRDARRRRDFLLLDGLLLRFGHRALSWSLLVRSAGAPPPSARGCRRVS